MLLDGAGDENADDHVLALQLQALVQTFTLVGEAQERRAVVRIQLHRIVFEDIHDGLVALELLCLCGRQHGGKSIHRVRVAVYLAVSRTDRCKLVVVFLLEVGRVLLYVTRLGVVALALARLCRREPGLAAVIDDRRIAFELDDVHLLPGGPGGGLRFIKLKQSWLDIGRRL